MRTCSVLALRPVYMALVGLGFDPGEVFRRSGVDPEILADPDARLSAPVLLGVFAEATRVTDVPAFGLRAAAAVPPGALETVDVVARSSPTVGVAVHRFAQYYALIDSGARIEVSVEGDLATIAHVAPRVVPPPPAAVEMLFGLLVLRTRDLAKAQAPVRAIRFVHDAPPDRSEHERFFGMPVTFRWPRNEIVVERAWLDAPIATADPAVAGLAERFVRSLIAGLPPAEGIVGDVRAAVAQEMASGPPRRETIARRLGMSPRTLQRRLTEVHRPFAAIVDEVRRDAALAYLAKRQLSISEVGYILGFSEPSAFHRAFRRWTGLAPSDYRKDPRAPRSEA